MALATTVETATYGSEFVAARTAVDQIIDIRTTLRYLGVPIRDKSYMFGDNRSVVTSSTSPTPPSPKDTIWHPIIESGKQLQLNTSHSIGKMAKATLLTFSANIGSLQLCGPCSSLLFWRGETATQLKGSDRILSTTPGAEPPRDVRDSGSARSHSTHLETSS